MSEQPGQSTPLAIGVDITPGPNGPPWIRVQVATVAVGSIFSFPPEHGRAIIDALTHGITQAMDQAEAQSNGQGLSVFADVPDAMKQPPNRAARRRTVRDSPQA